MVNKKIEKEQVLNPCLKLCKAYLGTHLIKYRRLDALDTYHESGDPDIEIWIPQTSTIFILMAECKKPEGGIVSKNQIIYRDKYKEFTNVQYVIITSPIQLKQLLFSLSHYRNKEIEDFNNIKEL